MDSSASTEVSHVLDAFSSNLTLSSSVSNFFSRHSGMTFNSTDRAALSEKGKLLLGALYTYAVNSDRDEILKVEGQTPCLKNLFVEGFDVEQIWSQFERFDRAASLGYKRMSKRLNTNLRLISDETDAEVDALLQMDENTESEQEMQERDDDDGTTADVIHPVDASGCGDKLEDGFLTLAGMRDFLDEAEEEEYQKREEADDDILGIQASSSDSEANDLFANHSTTTSGEERDDDDMEHEDGNRQIMYEDFFGPRQQKTNTVSHSAAESEISPNPSAEMTVKKMHKGHAVKKTKLAEERAMIQKSIQVLEDEAMAEKEWPFRGEIAASERPLNSALEVDLDYDTTLKPPPKPTQADMDAIEEMIRRRIGDRNFDDVKRIVPPPIEETKRVIELDDTKAKKGLGELYEDAYMKNSLGSGTLEEKEEKLRTEARRLFKEACASLDALTHFHFAPRPVVEDMSVSRVHQATVQMETTSTAVTSTKAPQEIYHPVSKTGEVVHAKELTKDDKKQMRAKRKRAQKASKRAETMTEDTKILGRKSLTLHARETTKKKRKPSAPSEKSKPGTAVFQKIQMHQENLKKVDGGRKGYVYDSAQMKL